MKRTLVGIGCLLCVLTTASSAQQRGRQFDLVIRNGWVVDGTGNPPFPADVGITNGKIVAVGRLATATGTRVIDANGFIVSPGFIDIHSHSDSSLLVNRKSESVIRQGWTTLVNGNCGNTLAPGPQWSSMATYLRQFDAQPLSINVATFVGHHAIRRTVLGMEARLPNQAELEKMKALVADAMESGAMGLSVGLSNAPGMFSDTNELIELTKVVARYGGIDTWHQRFEGYIPWTQSIKEALEVAEKGGVGLQFSHLTPYYPNWGRQNEAIELLEEARRRGVDVTTDLPPYLRGGDPLSALLPDWMLAGGFPGTAELLKSPENREKVRHFLLQEREKHRLPEAGLIADGHADRTWIKTSQKHPEYISKSLAEIALLRGKDPIETAMDLLVEEGGDIGLLTEFRREDDVQRLLQYPQAMIEADEAASAPYGELGKTMPHPRTYGLAPMVFRKYVRGEAFDGMPGEKPKQILTVQEAVRKMTSFPAQRLGLRDRGLLREGMWADVVIFDPQNIRDRATWTKPHQYPEGIPYVIVNGIVVVDRGEHTGAFPGKVLRGPGEVQK
jgi:N-acyl-D-aspartate/D-glutamate deacylase